MTNGGGPVVGQNKLLNLLLWADDWKPSRRMVQYIIDEMLNVSAQSEKREIRSSLMRDTLLQALPLCGEDQTQYVIALLLKLAEESPTNIAMLGVGHLWDVVGTRHPERELLTLLSEISNLSFSDRHVRRLLSSVFFSESCTLLLEYLLIVKNMLATRHHPASLVADFFSFSGKQNSGLWCVPKTWPEKGFTFHAALYPHEIKSEPRLFSFSSTTTTYLECFARPKGIVVMSRKGDKPLIVEIPCTIKSGEWTTLTVTFQYRMITSSMVTVFLNHTEAGSAGLKYPTVPSGETASLMLLTHRSRKNSFSGLVGSILVLRDSLTQDMVSGLKKNTNAAEIQKITWCYFSPLNCTRRLVLDTPFSNEVRGLCNAERTEDTSSHHLQAPPGTLRRAGGASLFVLLLKRYSQLHLSPDTDITLLKDCVITTVDVITSLCEVGHALDMVKWNGFGLISLALQTLPAELLPLHVVRTLTGLLNLSTTQHAVKVQVLHQLLIGVSGFNIWRRANFEVQSFMLEQVSGYIARQCEANPSAFVTEFENTVIDLTTLIDVLQSYYSTSSTYHKSHFHLQPSQVTSIRGYIINIIWRLISSAGGKDVHLNALLKSVVKARDANDRQLQDIMQLLVQFLDLSGGRPAVVECSMITPVALQFWTHPSDLVKMLAVKLFVLENPNRDMQVLGCLQAQENSIHVYTALKEAAMRSVNPSATTPEFVEWGPVKSPECLENLFVAAFSLNMHPYFQSIARIDLEKGLAVNRDAVVNLAKTRPISVLLSHMKPIGMAMTSLAAKMCSFVIATPHGVEFIKDMWRYLETPIEGVDRNVFMLKVFTSMYRNVEKLFCNLNLLDFNATRSLMSAFAVMVYMTHDILVSSSTSPEIMAAADNCLTACLSVCRTADKQSVMLLDVGQTLARPPPLTPGLQEPLKPATGSVIYEILLAMAADQLGAVCTLHAATPSGVLEQKGIDLHKLSQNIKLKATSATHTSLSEYLSGKLEELHGKFDTQVTEAQRLSDLSVKLLTIVVQQRNDGTNPVAYVLHKISQTGSWLDNGATSQPGLDERRSMGDVVLKFVEIVTALNPITVSKLQAQPGGLRELDPAKWTDSITANYKLHAEEYLSKLNAAMPSHPGAEKSCEEVIVEYKTERTAKIDGLIKKLVTSCGDQSVMNKSFSSPRTPSSSPQHETSLASSNVTLHADWGRMERKVKDSIALQWWESDRFAAIIPPLCIEANDAAKKDPKEPAQTERIFWKIDPSCRVRTKRWKPVGKHAGVGEYVKKTGQKMTASQPGSRLSLEDLKALPRGSYMEDEEDEDEIGAQSTALEGENERIASQIDLNQAVQRFEASLITPVELVPGELTVTPTQIMFVLDKDKIGQQKDSRRKDILIDASNVVAVYPRRYYLQQNSLELFVEGDTTPFRTYLFKLESTAVRKTVVRTLRARKYGTTILRGPPLSTRHVSELMKKLKITEKWAKGGLTNFDYLLELNLMAGRSFSDVNQYPIFPWVLQDYTSETIDLSNENVYRDLGKPVGALNETRLKGFVERFEMFEGGDIPKFHYGSHYSYGGAVLYYLVRMEPFASQALKLQDGYWDIPDRMFHSLAATWQGVTDAPTDVKELVPEFFSTPEFLVNHNKYTFGNLSNGTPMDNVDLPPWANNDPNYFIYIMRSALESPHVTANLHKWIDLVFGYKQKGDKAIEAHNTFYYLTYEGVVDWDKVDPDEAEGLQKQILSFGQTPSQLFTSKPHVSKGKQTCRPISNKIDLQEFSPVCDVSCNTSSLVGCVITNDQAVCLSSANSYHALKYDPLTLKLTYSGKEIKPNGPAPSGTHPWSPWQTSGSTASTGDTCFDPMADTFITPSRITTSTTMNLIYTVGHWGSNVHICSAKKPNVVADYITPFNGLYMDAGCPTAIHCTERYLVIGTSTGLVEVLIDKKTTHILRGHAGPISALCGSAILDTVVTAAEGELLVYGLRKGQLLRGISLQNDHNIANVRKIVLEDQGWSPVIVVLCDRHPEVTDCRNTDFLDAEKPVQVPQAILVFTLNGRLVTSFDVPLSQHVTDMGYTPYPLPLVVTSGGDAHLKSGFLTFSEVFPKGGQRTYLHSMNVSRPVPCFSLQLNTGLHAAGVGLIACTSAGHVFSLDVDKMLGGTDADDGKNTNGEDVKKSGGLFSGW